MKLLVAGNFHLSGQELDRLKEEGYEVTFLEEENSSIIHGAEEYEVVVCNFLFVNHDIRQFRKLKAVQLLSAGLDRMPMDYAQKHGIDVRNAKGVYSIPIAEIVVMSVLESYKDAFSFYENQKQHKWIKQRNLDELSDKTICIFGTGNVGIEVAKRFSGFTDNIIGVDIFTKERPFFKKIYGLEDKEIALGFSDVVVLTLPLTDQTYHMFDEKLLRSMKNSAVLVNVARGGLIDESALKNMLAEGKFRTVILDVFEKEPLDDSYWGWTADRVRIMPHNSFVSVKNEERMRKLVMNNLSTWMKEFGC